MKFVCLEGYHVSELLFQILTGSGDIGGVVVGRKKPKILENTESGGIGMKLGGKNKQKS